MAHYPQGTEGWSVPEDSVLDNHLHSGGVGKWSGPGRKLAFEGELADGDSFHYWTHDLDLVPTPYPRRAAEGSPNAAELSDRLAETVAAVEDVTATSGVVTFGFDLFSSQTGGEWTSTVKIDHRSGANWVIASTVRCPKMDMSTRDPVETMTQLGHFLLDVPFPRRENTATIYKGVVQFHHADDKGQVIRNYPKWWFGTQSDYFASFIELLVENFVNESTADTLDQYPSTP